MKTLLYLAARGLLVAAGVGAALPGCITVGDDDDDHGGESGGAGKGGSGTGGAGMGAAGDGSCLTTGEPCESSSDCCSTTQTNGACVDRVCRDGCTKNADCATDCCFVLVSGGHACAPADYCP